MESTTGDLGTDDQKAAASEDGQSEDGSGGRELDFSLDNLGAFIGRLLRGVAFDHVLSKLLAIAAQAESVVCDVLAIQLGRDEQCMEILSEILGGVATDKRLKLLEDMLSAHGWTDEFPEVIPILKRLQAVRNQLAHSYNADDSGMRGDGNVYYRRSYRRGRETNFQIDAEEAYNLTESAERILSESLAEIARRSMSRIRAVDNSGK